MSSVLFVCKESHINLCRITKGTTADCVGGNDAVVAMYIKTPADGTEMNPGELLEVPKADFNRLWQEA